MSDDIVKPVITPDSIIIPRFGGIKEKLPLPPGSQALVTQYIEYEQLEEDLDTAMITLGKAKKIITNSRKQFVYEIMGKAKDYSNELAKKDLVGMSKEKPLEKPDKPQKKIAETRKEIKETKIKKDK